MPSILFDENAPKSSITNGAESEVVASMRRKRGQFGMGKPYNIAAARPMTKDSAVALSDK